MSQRCHRPSPKKVKCMEALSRATTKNHPLSLGPDEKAYYVNPSLEHKTKLTCLKARTVLTSSVKDSTTSDLDSWFSSSCPISMMEVLCPLFSFCSLNSPPFETGMLSRFAISWLTELFSSSIYIASISFDTNLGNLPAWIVLRNSKDENVKFFNYSD